MQLSSGVGIGLENKLTSYTAFALLHFLLHASALVFDGVAVSLPFGLDDWVMDSAVAALLRRPIFRLRGERLSPEGVRSFSSLKAAAQLVECRTLEIVGIKGLFMQMPVFVASGKQLAKRLIIHTSDFVDCVDQLVNVSFST